MASLVNGEIVDEIYIDDEDDEDGRNSSDSESHCDSPELNVEHEIEFEDDQHEIECGEAMDFEDTYHSNQPVDFIFSVEDDNGVEADTKQQVPSEMLKILTGSDEVAIPQASSPTQQMAQTIQTRSALRSGKALGQVLTARKRTAPQPLPSPAIQLRSSVREARNVQNNKPVQSTPSASKKSTSTPTTNPPNPTPSQPKSAKKVTTINSNSNSNGTKTNTKKPVIKKGSSTPTTNGTKAKQTGKGPAAATSAPAGKPVIKRNQYWSGKEHCKQLGPESPYVLIERLKIDLPEYTEFKGHDCLNTPCPARRKRPVKAIVPPPPIEPIDNLTSTIAKVASNEPFSPPPSSHPQIGQTIQFRFWQTPVGNNILTKSTQQRAKIISYDSEFNLFEIKLFDYAYPFVINKDNKALSKRVATNTMLIDWDSLADAEII